MLLWIRSFRSAYFGSKLLFEINTLQNHKHKIQEAFYCQKQAAIYHITIEEQAQRKLPRPHHAQRFIQGFPSYNFRELHVQRWSTRPLRVWATLLLYWTAMFLICWLAVCCWRVDEDSFFVIFGCTSFTVFTYAQKMSTKEIWVPYFFLFPSLSLYISSFSV
jgi:hypothetical protein